MPEFLTLPEVARLARVSLSTIRREIERGSLRAARAGTRRVVIPREEVLRWLRLQPADGAQNVGR